MSLYDTLVEELKDYHLGAFDKAEQERRIAICQGCENYVPEEHKCGVCKCSISWNVLLTANSCPAGKWSVKRDA